MYMVINDISSPPINLYLAYIVSHNNLYESHQETDKGIQTEDPLFTPWKQQDELHMT